MTISRASWDSARAMLTICLAGGGQPADLAAGRDLGVAEPGEQLAGSRAIWLAAADEPGARRLVAEEDVVGDARARRRGRAPGRWWRCRACMRGLRVGEADRLAAPARSSPGVGLVRAGQHLDQGGLAGAVLAEQAVHLAGAHLQVDAVERAHAGELLDDAAHLQQRGVVIVDPRACAGLIGRTSCGLGVRRCCRRSR